MAKLKVCNVHYNRDRRRHQQSKSQTLPVHITDYTCKLCHRNVKATKSYACQKHVVKCNNGELPMCAVPCTFFSEYVVQTATIEDHEEFYHKCNPTAASQIQAFVCKKCNEPFLEMAKNQKKLEQSQKRLKAILEEVDVNAKNAKQMESKLLCESPNKENIFCKATSDTKELKAHQYEIKEVLYKILEVTKNEDDMFVGVTKKSSLILSKNILLNGVVTSNKKLIVNFLKDSVLVKYEVIGKTVKTNFILKPQHRTSMQSLTREILVAFEELQSLSVCLGIFEEHWVSACQHYNLNNKYKGNKTMFQIDNEYTLKYPKQVTAVIRETVRSTIHNGSECQIVLPKSDRHVHVRQLRCEPCKLLLRNCIRKLPRALVNRNLEDERTSPHSFTPLTSLGNEELLRRCRRMGEYIVKLKQSRNRLLKLYENATKKENLMELPENVSLTSGKLGTLMELALSKNLLQENSVLYALLCDTVTSLMKAEVEGKKSGESKKKMHPKGMRFHPVVLKWCAELAGKCGQGGYNLVREILPIPSLPTVNSYRQSHKSYNVVSQENLKLFSQELTRRNCKGLGGIHWDEIYIKKGIKVCARTNQLVGFEDLEIPENITEVINLEEIEHTQTNSDHMFEYNINGDSSTDDNSTSYDTDGELGMASCRPMAKTILQFFWSSIEGDFTWPVASFPINNINAKILGNCVWNTISILSEIQFGKDNENKVQVLYGVCDGATHSSAFFNQLGSINWMTENPYNNNNPIFWLSDPPHMIKKLRNFLTSQKRNLRFNDFEISIDHLTDVAERGLTKLSSKHLFLTSRTKMSVKRAAETCCKEVADDILYNSKYGFQKTLMTRQYIRKVSEYFKIMNSISVKADTIQKLIKVLVFFKRWFTEINEQAKDHRGGLTEHWKKFISKHTYFDLTRSIRGFIGLISYVKINHPDTIIVPRTTNQDDVENYFSLQRSRIAGGEPTVQQYMEGNSSLSTSLLIKAEKEEHNKHAFIGSYAALVTPNFVSVPLKRKKKNSCKKLFNNQDVLRRDSNHGKSYLSVSESEVESFHTQKDEQQLYRHAEQVLEHITVKSPSTIIGQSLKLVSILREKQNRQHLLQFLKKFNFLLRHQHFVCGKWHTNSLNDALTAVQQDNQLQGFWQTLLVEVNVAIPSNQMFHMFSKKFCKRRCVTFLAIDEINPKSEDQKTAIRQMLRSFDKEPVKQRMKEVHVKSTDICFKCGEQGHWAKQCQKKIPHDPAWLEKQQCFACGQTGHLKVDCKSTVKVSGVKDARRNSSIGVRIQ